MAKAILRDDMLWYRCPACGIRHMLNTDASIRPAWNFDGDFEAPTVMPSVLVRGGPEDQRTVCHHFIRDGKIEFLSDCTHGLAGTTQPMEEISDGDIDG